jgi:uncharacterized membrane protein HdeD (DUF308 family)
MTSFTMIVIMGVLMILGGISMLATPLLNFISAGYLVIILFFVWGIFGIARGISEKSYDKKFFFAILSLILGVVGLVVPGAAVMNNFIILYLAAGWFIIHGVLSIIDAIAGGNIGDDAVTKFVGIALGVLEIALGIYSIAHPAVLAVSLGLLIGFYFIESGVNAIIIGKATCAGGNSTTILFTVMGVLTIIGGISMLATPLFNFLGAGPSIIMLFFINGVVGIVQAMMEGRYEKDFWLAILSVILGLIGVTVPGIADMTNSILLYIAAGWFVIHGVMSVINAIRSKSEGVDTVSWVIGIILGVAELILAILSVAQPAMLAISLGLLIAFYFIESGIHMIFLGACISRATEIAKAQ